MKNQTSAGDKTLFITLFASLLAVTFVIRLIHLDVLNHIVVIPDEFTYWAHAANLAGLNWTKVTHFWYSYGFSLFILPLFFFIHNVTVLYKTIVVLNSLLSVLNVIIGYKIIKELNIEKMNKYVAVFISFIAFNFSSYIAQSQIAWSESLQFTIFILIIYVAVLCFKKISYIRVSILTVLCMYLYTIHNRNMGMFIALAMVLILMLFLKQANIKHILLSVGIIAICLVFDKYFRSYITNLMWNNISDVKIAVNEISNATNVNAVNSAATATGIVNNSKATFSGNNLGSVFSKIKITSIDFWVNLIISYSGKIWSNLTSTFLISFFGVAYICKNIFNGIKNKKWDFKNNLSLFLFLGIAAAFTAVALYNMQNGFMSGMKDYRADILIYTRYTDIVSGILIILGLCYIFTEIDNKKFFVNIIISSIFYIVMFLIAYLDFSFIESGHFVAIHVPSILFFKSFDMRYHTLFALGAQLLIFIIAYLFKNNKKYIFVVIYGIFAFSMFNVSAYHLYDGYIKPAQADVKEYEKGIELIKKYDEYPVMLFGNAESDPIREIMMSAFMGKKIHHSVDTVPSENYFVITNNTALKKSEYPEGTKFVWKIPKFIIGVVGEELQTKLENDKIYLDDNISRNNFYEVQLLSPYSQVVENEDGSFAVYNGGTMFVQRPDIEAGKYEYVFYVDGEIPENVTIAATTEMGTKLLQKAEDIKPGVNKISFEVPENDWSLELTIKNNDNKAIKISYAYLKDVIE